MLGHNPFDYPKAQASAFFTFGGEERLENMVAIFATDPRPIISDHDSRPASLRSCTILTARNVDANLSVLADGFHRIGQDVGE